MALNKKSTPFIRKLGLRKKIIKYYIWSVSFYGAQMKTLGQVDQLHLEGLKDGAEGRVNLFGPIFEK